MSVGRLRHGSTLGCQTARRIVAVLLIAATAAACRTSRPPSFAAISQSGNDLQRDHATTARQATKGTKVIVRHSCVERAEYGVRWTRKIQQLVVASAASHG